MTTQIRQTQPDDINTVMKLWLSGNLTAHDYVPACYWQTQQDAVKKDMVKSQLWLYEADDEILGFIGLMDHYLAGLFVASTAQNQGIGSKLLAHVQGLHHHLTLTVYQKNSRALAFYQKHGFEIDHSQLDQATQEKELVMRWQKKA